jgi:hypothetical protein
MGERQERHQERGNGILKNIEIGLNRNELNLAVNKALIRDQTSSTGENAHQEL